MSEFLLSDESKLLLRLSFVLLLGWIAIRLLRTQAPSVAIAVARCLIVAVWFSTFLVLGGGSIRIAMLPADDGPAAVDRAKEPDSDRANETLEPATASLPAIEQAPKITATQPAVVETATRAFKSPPPAIVIASDSIGSTETDPTANAVSSKRGSIETLVRLLLATWLAVVSLLVLRLFVRAHRTRGVIQRSLPCESFVRETLRTVATRMQLHRRPEIRISNEIAGPCTVGWLRPIILLPTSWLGAETPLTRQQFEMILAHELTHAAGDDNRWEAITQLTIAVCWFHPLVYAIARSHRVSCEYRCDAAACRVIGNAESYRRQLARWALAIRENVSPPLTSLSMAERPLMLLRLSWLKRGQLSENATPRKRLLVASATALISLACIAIQPTRQSFATDRPAEKQADTETPPPEAKSTDTNDADRTRLVATKNAMGYFNGTPPALDWSKTVTVSVAVMNQSGASISQATVQLTGITDQQGTRGFFALEESGAVTDELGSAIIELPGGTRGFDLRVNAEGYSVASEDFNRLADRVEVRMTAGRVFRVRAVNEQGTLLPNAMPIVEGSNVYGREFKDAGNGIHISPVIAPERRWMRVADGSDREQPILFSDLIDLENQATVDDAGVQTVVLRQGVRLEGKLGPEVPRPITNGFVHVFVRDGHDHRLDRVQGPGIDWHEYTKISVDGTFAFASLPRGTHAQVFAICDGWQSDSPSRDAVARFLQEHGAGYENRVDEMMNRYNSKPQLFHLAADQPAVSIEVACRQTTALDVRVVDPIGNPIPDATVTMSPNLVFFGGLVIPGVQLWTDKMVRESSGGFLSKNPFSVFASRSFLEVKTGADGIAKIRNLPNTSDSFEVSANGYVMSAYPTTDAEKPGRYGLTGEMTPGRVTRRTITMEREQKLIGREIMVVDQKGKPITGIELTITAIATNSQDPDWQQWSVRRFGETSRKTTTSDGRVQLRHPQAIDNDNVELLSIRLDGRVTPFRSINQTHVIPAKADDRGFRITAPEPTESEKARGRWSAATAEYTDLLKGNDNSPVEILARLIERGDLLSLRQLLSANEFEALVPWKMLPEANRTELRNRSATERITTAAGERVVALAKVSAPRTSIPADSERDSLKEAAFVFDADGILQGVIGGRETQGKNLTFTNLGGTFNYFVRISGFEKHSAYEYASRWYKVTEPEKPALTVYHQANASTFAAFQGTKFPLAEYGFLGYGLNGVELPRNAVGKNDAGVQVPLAIVWDRRNGKFFGEVAQSHNGRAVYRVITEESSHFEPVAAKRDEITVIGGRRDFQNWHLWKVVIPEGESRTAKLELRDENGTTTRLIHEANLDPGPHNFQLLIEDAPKENGKQAPGDKSLVVVLVDPKNYREDRIKYKVPRIAVTEEPTMAGQGNYILGKAPLRFIEKRSPDDKLRLVWVIE